MVGPSLVGPTPNWKNTVWRAWSCLEAGSRLYSLQKQIRRPGPDPNFRVKKKHFFHFLEMLASRTFVHIAFLMVGPSFGSQCRPTKSFGSRECRPTKSIFWSENWKLRCMLFHLVEHCILFASPTKNNSFVLSKWSKACLPLFGPSGFFSVLKFKTRLKNCIQKQKRK